MSRAEYALEMGRLFAPFTEVAAANPHAMSREVRTALELATVTPENRLTSDPYTRRLVARDHANQGAAVLLASRGRARALGVPDEKLVYLHGRADVLERMPLERMDLSRGPASVLAAKLAIESAGMSPIGGQAIPRKVYQNADYRTQSKEARFFFIRAPQG